MGPSIIQTVFTESTRGVSRGETRKRRTVKAITELSSLQAKAQNRKTSRGKVKVVPGGDLQDGGEWRVQIWRIKKKKRK